MRCTLLILMLFLSVPSYSFTVEKRLSDPALEKQARSIFTQIKCVVCDGQSIADSEVELAKDLRYFIRAQLKSGASQGEITEIIASKYGDKILFSPRLTPSNYILWFSPLLLLIVGFLWIFRVRKASN